MSNVPCRVCGNSSNGFHYSVLSCEACKGFFRRSVQKQRKFACKTGLNNCGIWNSRGIRCAACRFQLCLDKGMLPSFVRMECSPGSASSGSIAVELVPSLPAFYAPATNDDNPAKLNYRYSFESIMGVLEFAKRNNCLLTLNIFRNNYFKNNLLPYSRSSGQPVEVRSGLARSVINNINPNKMDFQPNPHLLGQFSLVTNLIIDLAKTPGFQSLNLQAKKTVLGSRIDLILIIDYIFHMANCKDYKDLLSLDYMQELISGYSSIDRQTFVKKFCPEYRQDRNLAMIKKNPFSPGAAGNSDSFTAYQILIDFIEFFRFHQVDSTEITLMQMNCLLSCHDDPEVQLEDGVRLTLRTGRLQVLQVAQEYCQSRAASLADNKGEARFQSLFFELVLASTAERLNTHYSYYLINNPLLQPSDMVREFYRSRFYPLLQSWSVDKEPDFVDTGNGDFLDSDFLHFISYMAQFNENRKKHK